MNYFLIDDEISKNIKVQADGSLLCLNVPLARTGKYIYTKDDGLQDIEGKDIPADEQGIIEVYKSPDVLFAPETIASFEGKPVTIGHIDIDPSNWNEHAIGIGHNIRRDGDFLVGDLLISSQKGIDYIKSKQAREISLSYDVNNVCDGIGKAHQTAIKGKHIAIVEQGRAGPQCRIFDHKSKGEVKKLMVDENKTEKKSFKLSLKRLFNNKANDALEVAIKQDENGEQMLELAPAGEAVINADEAAKDAPPMPPAGSEQGNKSEIAALTEQVKMLVDILTKKMMYDKDTNIDNANADNADNTDACKTKDNKDEGEKDINLDPNKPMME